MAAISNIKHGEAIREKIMEAIVSYIEEHQYPSTVREIGTMVGLKSNSSVHHHLKRLFAEGKLETDTELGIPRAIRVPGYKYTISLADRRG